MFKAGDPMNVYDPASILTFQPGSDEMTRFVQTQGPRIMAQLESFNPEQKSAVERGMRERAAERARTGERHIDQLLREKREWAAQDAKSTKLKEVGNAAFKKGDFKTAYIVYSACMRLSPWEPAYPLNRAAVALKLKLYERAIEDASTAIKTGDFNRAKAYFRRGRAKCCLGEWDKAEEDYDMALKLQPAESTIIRGVEELKKLRVLSPEEKAIWVSEQGKMTLDGVFKPGEEQRCVDELLRSQK
ncbi:TPR-like protein [Mycena galericulata]|nr:TPR-like protein [Mycena galericulata]